jgi:hypothetical protein
VSDELGVGQSDTKFQTQFKELWKFGHVGQIWTFPQDQDQQEPKNVVLQAVGLDVLGAAIPLS